MQDQNHFLSLRVLILQCDGMYAAQCLDYDIVAQGASIAEAKASFERTIVGQILVDLKLGKVPLADFSPAPERLQRMFDRAERLEDQTPITLPPGIPQALICQQIPKDIRVL